MAEEIDSMLYVDGELAYVLRYEDIIYECPRDVKLNIIIDDYLGNIRSISHEANRIHQVLPIDRQKTRWNIVTNLWDLFEDTSKRYCVDYLGVKPKNKKTTYLPFPEKIRHALSLDRRKRFDNICRSDHFKAIDYLYVFRNARHNNKKADKKFLEKMKSIPFAHLSENDPIPLDTLTVCSFVDSVDKVIFEVLTTK